MFKPRTGIPAMGLMNGRKSVLTLLQVHLILCSMVLPAHQLRRLTLLTSATVAEPVQVHREEYLIIIILVNLSINEINQFQHFFMSFNVVIFFDSFILSIQLTREYIWFRQNVAIALPLRETNMYTVDWYSDYTTCFVHRKTYPPKFVGLMLRFHDNVYGCTKLN